MIVTDTHVFFYGGAFSQWAPMLFAVKGVTYTCAEQFMMAEKAKLFGDTESMVKIMCETHPAEQKRLGRKVKNFVESQWQSVALDIVTLGNVAKFTHDEERRKFILDTGDKVLVEASPTDRIWGIGLGPHDQRIYNPAEWQGTNLLGQALMNARKIIKESK